MKRVRIFIPAEGKHKFLIDITPRSVVPTVSAALLWEAQMLCWLACGDHEDFRGDMKRGRILIPA